MTMLRNRRAALQTFGLSLAVTATGMCGLPSSRAHAAILATLTTPGATRLRELMDRRDRAPRRRDFKTVPMILNNPDQWDNEALAEALAYKAAPKQVWDNTDIAGPWLNLMRK